MLIFGVGILGCMGLRVKGSGFTVSGFKVRGAGLSLLFAGFHN